MNQMTLVVLLLWSSGTASAIYVQSPEEVATAHDGTTGRDCGVPTVKPVVSGCTTDGLGIINGTIAVPHSWPWQVSLEDHAGRHFCGGSLINENWVVTAAHCEVKKSNRVILGEHNLKDTVEQKLQKKKIGKVFNHPEYDDDTIDYDIALIKLQSPAQINTDVSPVCVAEIGDNFAAGMKCVSTGWGQVRHYPPSSPMRLHQVCVPLVSDKECKSKDGYGMPITKQMFCAGAAGGDTCQGDSGGPLVCEKNGAWTLVGVTSWGLESCPTHVPGIYTSVTSLRAWMDKIMEDN